MRLQLEWVCGSNTKPIVLEFPPATAWRRVKVSSTERAPRLFEGSRMGLRRQLRVGGSEEKIGIPCLGKHIYPLFLFCKEAKKHIVLNKHGLAIMKRETGML